MKRWSAIAATPIIVTLAALIYSYSFKDTFRVCYRLDTDASAITKVYWSATADFAEARSVGARVAAGRTRICLTHPDMRYVANLRIDPTDIAGAFGLDQIEIYRLDLLQPWRYLQRVHLTLEQVLARQQIENVGPDRFASTANDPYFVWHLQPRRGWHYPGVILNPLTVGVAAGVLCLICLLPIGGRHAARLSPWPASIFLGFFLVCLGTAWLARGLNDLWMYLDRALYLSLGLLAVYLLLFRAWGAGPRAALALAVLAAIGLSIGFDAGYRFGWFDRPVFAKVSHDAYHWRLTRRASENLDNASLRYYGDFDRLRTILRPRSYFVADLATSYYVNAALPVYPKVMQPHHGRYYAYYEDALAQLCNSEHSGVFKRSLRATVEEDRVNSGSVPAYFFVNKDRINNNIRNHCLSRNMERVSAHLAGVGERIYEGEYLDVYALDYSRF